MPIRAIYLDRFFEGVPRDVGPSIYLAPLLLALVFTPVVDLILRLGVWRRRHHSETKR